MNFVFEAYFAVFAVFASLFITELISAAALLLFWKQASAKAVAYVAPMWELTGTFAAFLVVVGDIAFPSLLVPLALTFAPLLTVFLIFFIARNASLAYAEFTVGTRWLAKEKLYRIYAVTTLILGIIVLILTSALVSGAGVNLSSGSFQIGSWLFSHGSVLFVVGALLVVTGLVPALFSLGSMKKAVLPLTTAGVGVSVLAYYLYSASFVPLLMLIPVVLTLLVGGLSVASKGTASVISNKAVFVAALSVIIFSLQFVVYPSAVGGQIHVDTVTTSGPMTSVFFSVTAFGCVLLGVMLAFFINVAKRAKNSTSIDYPLGSEYR